MNDNHFHTQIIQKVCTEILLPIGVFQEGSSRTYIDDNGWFFTVMEFQPSSGRNGTYLNIGLHFLWKERAYISFDFPFGNAIRVKEFAAYESDEQFELLMREYAEIARERVLFYRKFREQRIAKKYAWIYLWKYRKNPQVQEFKKFFRLNEDEIKQAITRTRNIWHSKSGFKKMPYHELYDK